jgi:hypothetical protein
MISTTVPIMPKNTITPATEPAITPIGVEAVLGEISPGTGVEDPGVDVDVLVPVDEGVDVVEFGKSFGFPSRILHMKEHNCIVRKTTKVSTWI